MQSFLRDLLFHFEQNSFSPKWMKWAFGFIIDVIIHLGYQSQFFKEFYLVIKLFLHFIVCSNGK